MFDSFEIALIDSSVIGSFTTIFFLIFTISFASAIISSAVTERTSAKISLSSPTNSSISLIVASKLFPDLEIIVGFVVTPLIIPNSNASLISEIFEVSI